MSTNVAKFETLKSLGFASISGTYAQIGTPFNHAMRAIRIINNTDGDMIFSVDAVNENFFLPAGSFVLWDITSNSDSNDSLKLSKNTPVYVKQSTAASSGSVYVEGIFGRGE